MRKHNLVHTKLPVNVTEAIKPIFLKREKYRFPILRNRLIKNVFLSHYGILLKNLLPVAYSLPNAFGFKKPNAGFIFEFYKKGLEVCLVSRYGKSLELTKLSKDKTYLLAFSPWMGYFSWITESLPRIYSAIGEYNDLTLILPESYSKKKFVMESLELFPSLSFEVIQEGVNMEIPKIVLPELKPFTYSFDQKTMVDYREKVWKHVQSLNLSIDTYENIYVSRKKAKNRKISNEEAVIQIVESLGYKEVEFEDYSFFEQVHLMMHCENITGVHGAGFANIAFLKSHSNFLELIKEYSSYVEERPSYWRLSSVLDINYYIQYCKPIKYGNYDLWVSVDLIVDLNLLEKNLLLISD